MELKLVGTNIEVTATVQEYVERKLSKLDKHLPDIIETKVEISEEQTKSPQERYLIRVTTNSGAGKSVFHGEERAEDLLRAVDKVAAVMIRQLERFKGKLYDKGRGNPQARGKFNQDELAAAEKKVVKTKRFILEPMSTGEAIEQMLELGHSFYLFSEVESGEVRLLYKRNDGDYGVIRPEFR